MGNYSSGLSPELKARIWLEYTLTAGRCICSTALFLAGRWWRWDKVRKNRPQFEKSGTRKRNKQKVLTSLHPALFFLFVWRQAWLLKLTHQALDQRTDSTACDTEIFFYLVFQPGYPSYSGGKLFFSPHSAPQCLSDLCSMLFEGVSLQ